jgi:5-methylcytosine-specific restriction endonuclease McrA
MASSRTQRTKRYKSKLRIRIWIAYNKKCYYCARPLRKGQFTIDHVVPKSDGGGNGVKNMVPACRKCNLKKGSYSAYEFCIRFGKMPLEGDKI